VTTLHRCHDLAVTTDEDAYLDRLHEAREAATAPDGPCTCSHGVECDRHWLEDDARYERRRDV